MTLKIAIVDCIGLDYDGTTLEKKGIGGSESSIISIAKELTGKKILQFTYNSQLRFDVKENIRKMKLKNLERLFQ